MMEVMEAAHGHEGRGRGGGRRRRAEARGQVLGDVGDAALKGDLALGGVARDDVGLGADDVQDDVGGEVAAELGQPEAHFGEGLGVRDGVAEDAGVGAAVVEARDGAEAFLAGWTGRGGLVWGVRGRGGARTGVPDLEADDCVRVGVDDALGHEASADGGCDLVGLEGAFAVAHDQRRLADALGAEDDDLGLERRHCCPFVVGVWGKEVEQKATERLCRVGCARLSLLLVRGGLVEVGAVGRTDGRLSGCQRFRRERGKPLGGGSVPGASRLLAALRGSRVTGVAGDA